MIRQRRKKVASFRPSIELLERRCVPTTLTPPTFDDGVLGSGSLRDAVLQFNADTGTEDDIIQLSAGTYHLTIQNVGGHHEAAGVTGDLNLTQTSHRWIIQGAGSDTIIDASQLQDRVFQIVNPGTQVVFQDLVIQGGLAQDNGADGAEAGTTDALGGGILNNGGNLTLNNVMVQNNMARAGNVGVTRANGYSANGGGLYSIGGALTLAAPTIANNQVTGGRGGDSSQVVYRAGDGGSASGAGLYASGGSLDLSDGMIANNRATGGRGGDGSFVQTTPSGGGFGLGGRGGAAQGGGLYVNGGSLTVASSTITSNHGIGGPGGVNGYYGGAGGGGLYILSNAGTLTVSNSTLSGNTASDNTFSGSTQFGGGGIYNAGALTVSNSTLSGNTTSRDGGGIYNGYSATLMVSNSTLSGNTASYGGAISNTGTVTVSNCTLSSNTADAYYGGGGGIFNGDGTLTVTDSTVSANSANGGEAWGGGIYTYSTRPVTLTNVTLTANRARTGGGLRVGVELPVLVLHNTLIAGNFRGATGTTRDDVSGALNSGGDYNLIGDGTGMIGLSNGVNGNLVGSAAVPIDPLLGPLQDNGGPTQTHALMPGSPAIDAGNNAYATDWDQRGEGFPRIVNGIIDIGAFEFQGAGPGPSPSRSSRGHEARQEEWVAGLPPTVRRRVVEPPALSPGQGSTITDEGLFVTPWEAPSGHAVDAVDSYFATAFQDRREQTTVPWIDLELAAIGHD